MSRKINLLFAAASLMVAASFHCVSNAAVYQPNHAVICLLTADAKSNSDVVEPDFWILPSVHDLTASDLFDQVHPEVSNEPQPFELPRLHGSRHSGVTRNA